MMLEVRDLNAYYGKSHILHGVNFTLEEGEVVSLLGRNGVGRSTTVKSIMGEVPPHGSIRFRGNEIAGLPNHKISRLGLGYVPENRDIFPTLTVLALDESVGTALVVITLYLTVNTLLGNRDMVMVTVGLLILLRGLVLLVFGPAVRPFPIIFPLKPLFLGDMLIPMNLLIGGIITIVAAVGLSWFFNRTRSGLRMTAVAEDHVVASSMGISVKGSIAFAWVLGAILSTIGAMIFLSGKSLTFLASDIGFAALPVALFAGLESIGGLILAGVIIGIVQSLTTNYLDPLIGGSLGSVVPYIIMLAILLIRPTGLFGWRTIERV